MLVRVVVISVVVAMVYAEKNTNVTSNSSPLVIGMQPFFNMMNNFLDIVQPFAKGTLMDLVLENQNLSSFQLGTFMNVNVSANYSKIATHYFGYTACIAAGVAFIVVMCIGGACICCCRCCCKKCGGKPGRRRKHDKWKRRVCSLLLFATTTVMLAGCVCAFLANELARQQTGVGGDGSRSMTTVLRSRLSDVSFYIVDSASKFSDKVSDVFKNLHRLVHSFSDLPQQTRNAVARFGNVDNIVSSGMQMGNLAVQLNATLSEVAMVTGRLQQLNKELSSNLSSIADDLSRVCDNIDCEDNNLQALIKNLHTDVNFSDVDNIAEELNHIREVAKANLTALILQGVSKFNSMISQVSNDTRETINKINATLIAVQRRIVNATNNGRSSIQDIVVQIANASRQIDSYKTQVDQYAKYRFYGGIGLCCVVLLIVILLYLGLCVGACTKAPEEEAGSCHRGIGANLLVAAVVFIFLTCWLIMLVTTILFVVGGLAHTEACRYMVNMERSPLLPTLQQSMKGYLPEGVNVNLSHSLQSCARNEALASVVNLTSMYNVSAMLDPKAYGLYDKMAQMTNISVNFSSAHLLSNDTLNQLIAMRDAGIDSINLTSFDVQLNRNLTSISLLTLAQQLEDFANTDDIDPDVAATLQANAERLRKLQANTVALMIDAKTQLVAALNELRNEEKGHGRQFVNATEHLIESLKAVDANIQANGSAVVRQFLRNFTMDIHFRLNSLSTGFQSWLFNDFAKCGQLYGAVSGSVGLVCVDVLYPVNAYWFGLGWCLFFFIPAVILALYLVTVYRRGEYDDDSDKDMDDPAYWWLNEKQTRQGLLSRKPETRIV